MSELQLKVTDVGLRLIRVTFSFLIFQVDKIVTVVTQIRSGPLMHANTKATKPA